MTREVHTSGQIQFFNVPECNNWVRIGECPHCGAPLFNREGDSGNGYHPPTTYYSCECRWSHNIPWHQTPAQPSTPNLPWTIPSSPTVIPLTPGGGDVIPLTPGGDGSTGQPTWRWWTPGGQTTRTVTATPFLSAITVCSSKTPVSNSPSSAN